MQNFKEAKASYETALSIKLDYSEGYNNLSNVFHDLGRIADAMINSKKAIILKPGFSEAYDAVELHSWSRVIEQPIKSLKSTPAKQKSSLPIIT